MFTIKKNKVGLSVTLFIVGFRFFSSECLNYMTMTLLKHSSKSGKKSHLKKPNNIGIYNELIPCDPEHLIQKSNFRNQSDFLRVCRPLISKTVIARKKVKESSGNFV